MTETAAPEVAVTEPSAAPSVEETTPVVETTPEVTPTAEETAVAPKEEPQKLLTKKEAHTGVREDRAAKARAEAEAKPEETGAATVEETGTPMRNKDGRLIDPVTKEFLPEDGEKTTDAPPVTTQEADQAPDPEGTVQTPEPVRIEFPPDHALLEMGKLTSLPANTPEEEELLKALINGSHTRRKDVEAADTKAREWEEKFLAEQTKNLRHETSASAEAEWKKTPEYRTAVEKYENIRDSVGQEEASTFWDGEQLKLQHLRDTKFDTRSQEVADARSDEAGLAWANSAWENANRLPEAVKAVPSFQRLFRESLETFEAKVSMGHFPDATTAETLHAEFGKAFTSRLRQDPEVAALVEKASKGKEAQDAQEAVRRQRAADAAAAATAAAATAAVDEYKKEAAQTRVDAPPHPLGGVHSTTTPQTTVEAGPDAETKDMTADQLRKHLRKGARQAASSYLKPT